MPSYPNQRRIRVHRERANTNFLGIKNENWQAAARDLRPHALLLYLYFASNADGYSFDLSPAAINAAVGMPRSTYSDQFQVLLNKGYLVQTGNATYDFYEIPRPRATDQSLSTARPSADCYKSYTITDRNKTDDGKSSTAQNREINNSPNGDIYKPKGSSEQTVVIKVPTVKTKYRPPYQPKGEGENFVF